MSDERTPGPAEVDDARASLRALVEAIDAGEVEADSGERAYLAGALDTLDRLSPSVSARRPGRASPSGHGSDG